MFIVGLFWWFVSIAVSAKCAQDKGRNAGWAVVFSFLFGILAMLYYVFAPPVEPRRGDPQGSSR